MIYHGPSTRFKTKVNYALKNKRSLWARFQINTTHELATVPNMPMIVSLYNKFKFMNDSKVSGFMGCWNFACYPLTLNTFAASQLSCGKFIDDEKKWLADLAKKYFGSRIDLNSIVKAWYGFDRACKYYPIGGNNDFLYFSPVNEALSYPLVLDFKGIRMGGSWIKHDFCDRLEDTAITYSLKEIKESFGKLSKAWAKALTYYQKAFDSDSSNARMRQEYGVAKIIGASFRSTFNIYKWYILRKNKNDLGINETEFKILSDELQNLKEILPYVEADTRCGFHQEAQGYMFDKSSIRKKIELLLQGVSNNSKD